MNNANKKIALISDYFNLYLITLFIIFIKPQLFSDYQNMKIGIPKEIKPHENLVGITPSGVIELVKHKHEVYVEKKRWPWSRF